jgi:hypothetical protein
MTMPELHQGPWRWIRAKIGGTWQAFLRGKPNRWNDTLVTPMREDLAAFPYAIDTPDARLMAAAPDFLAALKDILPVFDNDGTRAYAQVYADAIARAEAVISTVEREESSR